MHLNYKNTRWEVIKCHNNTSSQQEHRRKRLRLAGPCGKDFIKGVVGSGPSRTGWVEAPKKKKKKNS